MRWRLLAAPIAPINVGRPPYPCWVIRTQERVDKAAAREDDRPYGAIWRATRNNTVVLAQATTSSPSGSRERCHLSPVSGRGSPCCPALRDLVLGLPKGAICVVSVEQDSVDLQLQRSRACSSPGCWRARRRRLPASRPPATTTRRAPVRSPSRLAISTATARPTWRPRTLGRSTRPCCSAMARAASG